MNKYGKKREIPDTIDGIIIKDQIITEDFSSEPRVYGNITINENERSILILPPNYAVMEKVSETKCQAEVEKGLAKLRWERQQGNDDIVNNEYTFFDVNKNVFNYSVMKPSDLPFNKRVYLPGPLRENEEIELQQLKYNLKKATERYTEESKHMKSNLTKQQEKGLRSLERKCKEKEMIVSHTDKSGRQTSDTPDNYRISCKEHVDQDRDIDEKTHKECEKKINSHAIMWIRFLNAGKDKKAYDRIKSNMISRNSTHAPFSGLRKDHKIHEDVIKGPPSRPMCSGNVAYNHRLSHLVSKILTETVNSEPTVCNNTEDLIAEIERLNQEGIGPKFILGSTDVKAMYPSLDIDYTTEKVCEVFEQSEIEIKNVDYKELSLYIALNKTQQEIDEIGFRGICPSRKNMMGPRPKITGNGIK